MKKTLAMSTFMIITALLLTGCSGNQDPAPSVSDAPLISRAEGLGESKPVTLFVDSPFNQLAESTQGKVDFKPLESMDWKVERVIEAADGETLPAGDNFKISAKYSTTSTERIKAWAETLKADGWTATNEVKAVPQPDEEKYVGTKEDYRAKPYSVDLSKGKSSIKINSSLNDPEMTIIVNSQ